MECDILLVCVDSDREQSQLGDQMKHPGRGSWSPDGLWRHGDKCLGLASLHDFAGATTAN